MNKNELNRLVAWRLKLLRQADEMPRGVTPNALHQGLVAAVRPEAGNSKNPAFRHSANSAS